MAALFQSGAVAKPGRPPDVAAGCSSRLRPLSDRKHCLSTWSFTRIRSKDRAIQRPRGQSLPEAQLSQRFRSSEFGVALLISTSRLNAPRLRDATVLSYGNLIGQIEDRADVGGNETNSFANLEGINRASLQVSVFLVDPENGQIAAVSGDGRQSLGSPVGGKSFRAGINESEARNRLVQDRCKNVQRDFFRFHHACCS